MSIANLYVGRDAAHLYTDAGFVDINTGTVVGMLHKVAMLPEHAAAYTVVGPAFMPELIAGVFAGRSFADLETLVRAIPQVLQDAANGWHQHTGQWMGECMIVMEVTPTTGLKQSAPWSITTPAKLTLRPSP